MKPKHFRQANACLTPPKQMTKEQCGELFVHRTNDGRCISMWKTGFIERLKFLFHGRIWLTVLSGPTQPPVHLNCSATVFNPSDKSLWHKASKFLNRKEKRKFEKANMKKV